MSVEHPTEDEMERRRQCYLELSHEGLGNEIYNICTAWAHFPTTKSPTQLANER